MLSALDHVALVVQDRDGAVAQYQALLGRAPNWRGGDGGAAHAWFQLQNVALDIVAATGSGYTGDRVQARLAEAGEGIWAAAFAAADLQRAVKTLARRAIAASEPRPIRSTHVESGRARPGFSCRSHQRLENFKHCIAAAWMWKRRTRMGRGRSGRHQARAT